MASARLVRSRLRRRRACLACDGGSALSRGRWRTVRGPAPRGTGTAVGGALAAYAAVCVAVIAAVMASRDVTA
jgi:hypothetical protein